MAVNVSPLLATDDLTILLGLIGATVFLLHSFYRPQPLVHPILLGRQSDVARVRNPRESAVYRNYGTGLMGRFPVRPHKDVHILADLIRPESDAPRTLWNTRITNPGLQDRIAAFGTGLLRRAGLRSQESNVLLLLNDSLEFLISDLALASHSIPSFTLSSADLLTPVLESHPPDAIIAQADLLPQLLELIYEAGESARNHTIIVVGEPTPQALATVASTVTLLLFEDVEREGFKVEKILSPVPQPTDVFTVSYAKTESGSIQGTQLTHENITAGVAAIRGLLPVSNGLSQLDTIVSAFNLGTAYGRTVAYTAVFEGTSFATLASTKLFHTAEQHNDGIDVADVMSAQKYRIPSPTILFVRPGHSNSLFKAINATAQKNLLLFPFAWRQKVASASDGFIAKDSLWDRLVFDGARAKVIGEGAGTLRAVIVSGGRLAAANLTPTRVAFSAPFVNVFSHPSVAGPVLASHPLDLQDFSSANAQYSEIASVGPPSINVETKLVGVDDDYVEKGGDPEGNLLIRGPSVGKVLGGPEDYVNVPSGPDEEDGWVRTGVRAVVQPNGTFKILS